MRRIIAALIATSAFAFLTGCGGGGDDSFSNTPETGQLVDAPIAGLSYVRNTQAARLFTGDSGEFEYFDGETLDFSLGNLVFAKGIPGQRFITVGQLLGESAASESDAVVNLVRFFLTLDADSNPANGVSISDTVLEHAENDTTLKSSDFDSGFESGPLAQFAKNANNDGERSLTDRETALTHLRNTLSDIEDGSYDYDADHDGVPNDEDQCPNADDRQDSDNDGTPNNCDVQDNRDDDNDGVQNHADICPGFDDNLDADNDGTPNGCDNQDNGDEDNDGVQNHADRCPGHDDTLDDDEDGTPNGCDAEDNNDDDNDNVENHADVCPNTPNGEAADTEGETIGCSASQIDSDNDTVNDNLDACPGFDDRLDDDNDGTPDGCDNQDNGDDDSDGVENHADACPGHDDSVDTDGDGTADGCDSEDNRDSDSDGVQNHADACPNTPPSEPVDSEGCTTLAPDTDDDGFRDNEDNCPNTANPNQEDSNEDGVGDACEPPLDTVIRTGDIFAVNGYDPKVDLLDAVINNDDIIKITSDAAALVNGLYGSQAIEYRTSRRTQTASYFDWRREQGHVIPFLRANGGRNLGAAGHFLGEHGRFAAMGSVPMRWVESQEGVEDNPERYTGNASFKDPLKKLVAWLLGDEPGQTSHLNDAITVAIARYQNPWATNPDRDFVEDWVETYLPNATIVHCGVDTPLPDCATDAALILLGKRGGDTPIADDVAFLKSHLEQNRAVFYTHSFWEHRMDAGIAYAELLGLHYHNSSNFFVGDADRDAVWANANAMLAEIDGDYDAIAATLQKVKDSSFSFDFAGHANEKRTVDFDAVPGFADEFLRAGEAIRRRMGELDEHQFAIFTLRINDYYLSRALALIGDRLRQDISFPMDVLLSNQSEYLSSFLADHIVYNFREISPMQADRGFLGKKTYENIQPVTHSISLPTQFYGLKPTGAFALPGQKFTVSRTDSHTDIETEVLWNPIFASSVYVNECNDSFPNNDGCSGDSGYDQPKYSRSTAFSIKPGQTLTLVTPYGGVIQVDQLDQLDDPDSGKTLTFEFGNVGTHPRYTGPDDREAFIAALDADLYDWAEIDIPQITVTSTRAGLLDSLDELKTRMGWDIEETAQVGLDIYYNDVQSLSGYRGFGLPEQPDEVLNFCQNNGWDCQNEDYHLHDAHIEGNIEQSFTSCGFRGGCSSQPVQYTWDWDPLGAGPVHEIGHHLEGNSGADYHSFEPMHWHQLTNIWRQYAPFAYYKATNNHGACNVDQTQYRENGDRFAELQIAKNKATPEERQAHLDDTLWGSDLNDTTRGFILQMVAHAELDGNLTNGWNYFRLQLLLAREFAGVAEDGDEDTWNTKRDSYGFSSYSQAEAAALIATEAGKRDWSLIVYSLITGRDQRGFFTMMGFPFTQKASDQVAALGLAGLGLPAAAEQYYAFDDICSFEQAIPVPVDGTSTWPENRPTVFD